MIFVFCCSFVVTKTKAAPKNPLLPPFTLYEPLQDSLFFESPIKISGKTLPNVKVFIQCQNESQKTEILVSPNGTFSYPYRPSDLGPQSLFFFVETKDFKSDSPIKIVTFWLSQKIWLKIGLKTMTINMAKKISLDVAPLIENSRTLVPLRAISESFGADVQWFNQGQLIYIGLGRSNISMSIGSTTVIVNDEKKTIDVAPKIIKGRTIIPLRFISETFNAEIIFNNKTKDITIIYPKQVKFTVNPN